MKIFKCLVYIIFAIFWAREIPKNFKDYKKEKNRENFLLLFGRSLMFLASLILAIGVYI